jgi:hypothetical protein
MALFVDTVSADVPLKDLGIIIPHPTTNYNLSSQFSAEEIRSSDDLYSAITGGSLNFKLSSGGPVQTGSSFDPDTLELEQERTGAGYNTTKEYVLAATTITLKASDANTLVFSGGTIGQIVQLPEATQLDVGHFYDIFNQGSEDVEVRYQDGTTVIALILAGTAIKLTLTADTTANGQWYLETVTGDGSSSVVSTICYNETGATLPPGTVVYINGAHGNKPTITPAQADTEANSSKTFGLVQLGISDMAFGPVVNEGPLSGLNTNIVGWNEGDALWLSPTVSGGFTNVKPSAPDNVVFIGTLVRKHPTKGVVQVKIQNGYELEELHNVSINSLIDGQFLKYEDSTSLWKNHTLIATDVSDFTTAVETAVNTPVTDMLYVHPLDGDDTSGNGSFGNPYQTIAKALLSATPSTVISLFPGLYTEATITLPDSITIVGLGATNAVEIQNGFSHASGAVPVAINISNINCNLLSLDCSSATNGLVNIKNASFDIARSDDNSQVLFTSVESTVNGSQIDGGANTFNECLVIGVITVTSGLTVFENCKIVQAVYAQGLVTVRMLDCALFTTEFINGTINSGNTPVWEVDPVTEYLGGYTGDITKVILTNSVNTANAYTDVLEAEIKDIFLDTKEPTGHLDRTQSDMSFDAPTRTLSITPVGASFIVYVKGVKLEISTTLSKQIPNTSGNYFFYIDGNGALDYYFGFNLLVLTDVAYTAFVHWNATTGQVVAFGEERHGTVMDGVTHSYLHTTRGTQLVSGAAINYTLGSGIALEDAQIELSNMQVKDEDITANITHANTPTNFFEQVLSPIAYLPVHYRDGSDWVRATANSYPMLVGTNRAKYNLLSGVTWSLVEASANNKFLVSYVFATTNITEPVIVLLGQDQYDTLDDAKTLAAWDKITFGDLPAQEMKLLYIVFYETSSTYSNTPKSRIVYVSDVRFNVDRQVSAATFNGAHGNLSGLDNDDHLQYHTDGRGDARYYTKTQSDTNYEPKNANIQSHIASTANPHNTTKAQVGLGNVDDVSAANLRDRSTHTGNESQLTWNENVNPSTPALGLTTYSLQVGGRQMLGQLGKSGVSYSYQPFLARNRIVLHQANGNATTITSWGAVAPTASGTATTRNVATTNFFTWIRRVGYVTAAANNAVAGLRTAVLQYGIGNGARLGGFHFVARFGISDATLVAGARLFVGMTSSTAALGNADPSTFLNIIGVGMDAADTTLQFMHNDGAGTATKINLGASFPETTNTDMFEVAIYCAPNASTVFYEVVNLTTNVEVSGSVNTNLPLNTQLLAWQIWRHTANTNTAVGIDIASVYIESDN